MTGTDPAASTLPQDRAALAPLRRLRDAFIRRVDAEGYRPCPAPRLEPGEEADLVRYLPERNILVVSVRSQLARAARHGSAADAAAPVGAATLPWMLVHELGHWWQECRRTARPRPYFAENGADRIALAFWRERAPRFAAIVVGGAAARLAGGPRPAAAGEGAPAAFEAQFDAAAGTDTFSRLQAQMIVALAREEPLPSFHKSLSQPLYPY